MVGLKGRGLSRRRDDIDEQGLLPLALATPSDPIPVGSMDTGQRVEGIVRP